MVEGPAGTGKSFLIGHGLDTTCRTFPGARLVFIRQTRVSLNGSFLKTWEEEVLGQDHPMVLGGPRPESRDIYQYPKVEAVKVQGTCPQCKREAASKGMAYTPGWWKIIPELADTQYPCQQHQIDLVQTILDDDTDGQSEVRLAGMDNETRLFSTQYNGGFTNEMTELTLNGFTSLHRALRRQGTPFRINLGDANPDHEFHWANLRANDGTLKRIVTAFQDNPTIDQAYLSRLESLPGVLKERLFHGRWVASEGMILNEYSSAKHISDGVPYWEPAKPEPGRHDYWLRTRQLMLRIEGMDEPLTVKRLIGGQDIGWEDPGVLGLWAIDTQQRAWKICEAYFTHKTHDWWADRWCELWEEYGRITGIFCDHDNSFIESLNRRLRQLHSNAIWDDRDGKIPAIARKADKTPGSDIQRLMSGLNELKEAMRERPDGTYGFNLLRDRFKWGKDPRREEKRLPTCLEEEIPGYVFQKDEKSDTLKERPDPRCQEHAIDETRYAFRGIRSISLGMPTEEEHEYPEGSYGADLFKGRGGWKAILKGKSRAGGWLKGLAEGR